MSLCLYCKQAHDSSACPLYLRAQQLFRSKRWKLSSTISAEAPSPFIGHHGYPSVSVGVLSTPERVNNTWEYDAPRHWAVGNYQIPQLVDLRSSLVNSRQILSVTSRDPNRLDVVQEVGMATRPADVDLTLTKAPTFTVRADSFAAPTGPRATLQKAILTSNPTISSKVEKVVSDTDLKTEGAFSYLAKKGFDEQQLTKLLSVGVLGVGKRRKLVPTRWSITATDDILGKQLKKRLIDRPVGDICAHFGGYLGNHFAILFFDRPWAYELFEMSTQSSPLRWTTDHETIHGRKEYAQETAGGYYAARLGILQHLNAIKRQQTAMVIRFITPDYTVPLGVWVVREAVRKALQAPPTSYETPEQMINAVKQLSLRRFGISLDDLFAQSKTLSALRQRSLSSFL